MKIYQCTIIKTNSREIILFYFIAKPFCAINPLPVVLKLQCMCDPLGNLLEMQHLRPSPRLTVLEIEFLNVPGKGNGTAPRTILQ